MQVLACLVPSFDPFDPKPHQYRTLTPCLYDRHRLYVAPSDAPGLFAFDAVDGRILWRTSDAVSDATHLLGASEDALVISGDRLYWIGLHGQEAGRVLALWPESSEAVGYGRGFLSEGAVYWPTRKSVLVFDAIERTLIREHPLATLGVESGNLLAVGDRVFAAGGTMLTALATSNEGPEPFPLDTLEDEESFGPLTRNPTSIEDVPHVVRKKENVQD